MTILNADHAPTQTTSSFAVIEIDRTARWDVYLRLQELAVPCECKWNGRLRVQVASVDAAVQLWCVVQMATASKQAQVDHLERCWNRQ